MEPLIAAPEVPVEVVVDPVVVVVDANSDTMMTHRRIVSDIELMATAAIVEVAAQQATSIAVEALLPAVLSVANVASALQHNKVVISNEQDPTLLPAIDRLIAAFDQVEMTSTMTKDAPGFVLEPKHDQDGWHAPTTTAYETLHLHEHSLMPLPSPQFFTLSFQFIKHVIQLRQQAVNAPQSDEYCSCIAQWHFDERNALRCLINQAMEQLMVVQATQALNAHIPNVAKWNEQYNHTSDSICLDYGSPTNSVRILRHRDDYIQAMVELALASRSTICISTCYLHGMIDSFVRYLLFDLLRHCIERNGVQVQILIDLMTVEGAIVQTPFQVASANGLQGAGKVVPSPSGDITDLSFLKRLPAEAPSFTQHGLPPSNMDLFNALLGRAASVQPKDSYQVRWWCARDPQLLYRIKNHSKAMIFDDRVAIAGGSNIAPAINAATSEVDMVLTGPVVANISSSTNELWLASGSSELVTTRPAELDNEARIPMDLVLQQQTWTDQDCPIAFVRSTPSSAGEDCILRSVIDAVNAAKTSVIMSFGHSNYPQPIAEAFRNATARGVQVQVLVNSMFSCDLRGGQHDLFESVVDMLQVAPQVQVYSTVLRKNGKRPPFLHAKYVVIDGEWSAIGSWNMWHRACFYEIEHEAFVRSTKIAAELEAKFEVDKTTDCVLLETPEDCGPFRTKGCCICAGFGPFYAVGTRKT